MNTFTVPQGETPETIRQREDLIYSFYQQWKEEHPDQKIFNVNLKDYINIRSISITETARHASKRYLSTLAVLQLDSILSCARKVSYEKPEKRDNQLAFKAMLIMEHKCPGIGPVKLTVGIRHKTLLKVQYCITSIDI